MKLIKYEGSFIDLWLRYKTLAWEVKLNLFNQIILAVVKGFWENSCWCWYNFCTTRVCGFNFSHFVRKFVVHLFSVGYNHILCLMIRNCCLSTTTSILRASWTSLPSLDLDMLKMIHWGGGDVYIVSLTFSIYFTLVRLFS